MRNLPNWWTDLFAARKPKKAATRTLRLGIERLEDRTVPATVITIIEGAAGTGTLDGFLSATDGTLNATDSLSVTGTITRAQLQLIGANVPISITAQQSIVFDTALSGPVALLTQAPRSAQFLALNGSITFQDPADSLTTAGGDLTLFSNGGTLTVGTLATSGGNINLTSDSVDIGTGATINAGTNATRSLVTIAPATPAVNVDLGTETGGKLSLTDTELDRITARVLRVGDASTGNIVVSAAVSLAPANVATLALQTADTTATAITQTAALTVTNLAVRSVGTVALTNGSNDVSTLAASVTGATNGFSFTDTNGFQIATVDGTAGLTVPTGNPANVIALAAGGAVTQAAGANVTGASLALLGVGASYTLTNVAAGADPGNNVAVLAASVTGAISYTDANALSIGTVLATNGVTAVGNIAIATTDGDLSVTDANAGPTADVTGTGTVALTAGSATGQNRVLDIQTSAGVTGAGVTLTADSMSIAATVDAGAQTLVAAPFESGTTIELGSGSTGVLALSDTEIDFLTASVVRIGSATAGAISVTGQITPANTSQLELVTGAAIVDGNSTGSDITVTRLALTAATGIGVTGGDVTLDIAATNLEATTATGGISVANTGNLTVGGVNATLAGLSVTTSGDVAISSTGNLSVNEAVSVAGTGTLTATADSNADSTGDFNSTAALSTVSGNILVGGVNTIIGGPVTGGGSITLTATSGTGGDLVITSAVTGTGSTGNITLQADGNSVLSALVTASGTGTITYDTDLDSSGMGDLTITSGGLSTAGGDITITVEDLDINGGVVNATTGATSDVFIRTRSAADAINLGTANPGGTLGLDNADLGRITAGTLHIGSRINTGGIVLTGQVSLAVGSVPVLSLETSGTITETTVSELPDITATSLSLWAGTTGVGGIGATGAGDINVAVTNLAVLNASPDSGGVFVANTSAALNITTVAGQTGVVNQNATAATGPVSVTTSGALNVNENVTAAGTGDVALSAGGAATLAAGKTVQSGDSTAGGGISIFANAGNAAGTADITLGAGSALLTRGSVTLDADPDAVFPAPANGTGGALVIPATAVIAGPGSTLVDDINLRAGTDITLGALAAGGDITVITDANVLDDGVDTTTVTAAGNISLTASGAIGGATALTVADIESASTATPTAAFLSALDVSYGGTLTLANPAGNVLIRKVGTGLSTNSITITNPTTFVGSGNQLALISSAGDLTVNNAFAVDPSNNANLLLATTGVAGNDVVLGVGGSVTNTGTTATTTIMASGATSALITAQTANSTADVVVQNLVLVTTGGTIGATLSPLEFDAVVLNGKTTGQINGAAQVGGTAFLTDTVAGLQVGQFDAGTGDVTLLSNGSIGGTGSSLISTTPNDGVAEVIGATVTLNTTAATGNGATGQIGQFVSSVAQFFEVNATTLNAATNNSRLWISDVAGGVAVGAVSAGTENVFLRARNGGSITSSTATPGAADVVGAVVNLSAPEGGNVGTASSALEIDATTLIANVTGAGLINIADTAGGLTVQQAATTGNVTLTSAAGLVLGNVNTTATTVSAGAAGTVTLSATGAVTTSTPGTIADVSALQLAISAGTGIGSNGAYIEASVSTLAATSPTGGIFVGNTSGPMTIGTVGALSGVTAATSGNIGLGSVLALTIAQNVTGTGTIILVAADAAGAGNDLTLNAGTTISTTLTTASAITLDGGDSVTLRGALATGSGGTVTVTVDQGSLDAGTGGTVTIAPTATVTGAMSVTVTGGTDADTFNLHPFATVPITVTGGTPTTLPGDVLRPNFTNVTGTVFTQTGVGTGTYTFTNGGSFAFAGIENAVRNVITVTATDPNAAEGATPDTGTFTLTRVGDTSNALTITVVLTGTAANGVAYETLPTTVTFAPGAATATVTVTPRNNSAKDGSRTVVLTVTSAVGYDAGAPAAATVTIADNESPLRRLAVGTSSLGAVKVFDNGSQTPTSSFLPYAGYQGGVTVAVGDVTGDGIPDIVTGATDLSSHVKVFDGATGAELYSFLAFTNFNNGVGVAVGDLDNDGKAEVIVGALTAAPHVKVFDFSGGVPVERASFLAFQGSSSGITVAAGDTDGDGRAEIIVGARSAPHVKTFDLLGNTLRSFLAPNVSGGINVAAGDLDGNGIAEILVGSTANGTGVVTVFNADQSVRGQFGAGASAVPPTLTAVDANGDSAEELYVTLGPVVSIRDGASFAQLATLTPFIGFQGGVFVG